MIGTFFTNISLVNLAIYHNIEISTYWFWIWAHDLVIHNELMKFLNIDTAEWQRLMFGNERINKRIIARITYLIIIKQEMFFLVEYGNNNTSDLIICIFYKNG